MRWRAKSHDMAVGASAGISSAQAEADRVDIEGVLQAYETALNTSNAEAVMNLFTSGAVFMPQYSPSSRGTDEVRAAYNQLFLSITFCVELQVEEIVQIAPNWAFVRTSSDGWIIPLTTGVRTSDANHELFIFEKDDDHEWKIARYCFSTTNPPRQ
ncbi:uncharacterized protein (TIGR02246 family) [Bradyrhizobium sp. LB8.2]|uniref:YybH family protein n=1 Tax=unclassified Bradyrhizobium TaxID=2631580 RepID=UPI0033916A39